MTMAVYRNVNCLDVLRQSLLLWRAVPATLQGLTCFHYHISFAAYPFKV